MLHSLQIKADEIQKKLEDFLAFGEDSERFGEVLMDFAELVKSPGVPSFYAEELERVRKDNFGMAEALERAQFETRRMPESKETDGHRLFIALGERQKLRTEACKLLLSKLLKSLPSRPSQIMVNNVFIDTQERIVTYKGISRPFRAKGTPWLIVRLCVEGEGQIDYKEFRVKQSKTKGEIDTLLSKINAIWRKELNGEIVFRVKDGWICMAPGIVKG